MISTFRELTLHANDKLHHGVLFRLFNWVIIARKIWKWCAMKIWSVCEPEDIWWNGEMMQDDDFRLPFCFLQEVRSHTILSFTRKEKKILSFMFMAKKIFAFNAKNTKSSHPTLPFLSFLLCKETSFQGMPHIIHGYLRERTQATSRILPNKESRIFFSLCCPERKQ